MGRRKRAFVSDDSSSNDSEDNDYEEQELDGDDNAERELHEDPYQQRKRRRLNGRGKNDATYGIFGEDDDGGPPYKRTGPKRKAKTPVFKKSSTTLQPNSGESNRKQQMDEELDESDDNSDSDEESSGTSEEAEEAPQMAQVDEDEDMDIDAGDENAMDDEEDEKPTRGGIGSSRNGIGAGRTGLGMNFARAGILPETESVEVQPTTAPGGRGGIGSSSRAAGIGTRKVPTFAASSSTTKPHIPVDESDEPPSARVGLGAAKRSNHNTNQAASVASSSGLGITPPASNSGTSTPQQAGLPTAFGSRTQRAFVRNSQPATPGVTPVQLSYEEKAHFAKISGGFGARMMAKMGWEVGTGLGVDGHGIVTPVESKLRPKGAVGIAYGGFKERTKQAIAEDRRKGKKLSDDEDEDRPRRRGKHGDRGEERSQDKSEAWKKKTKPKKVAVEHKSYEEIVREAGLETPAAHQAGMGPIIDATGATPREVSSISAVSWTPSTDTMRIPEIRHNLRLMVDMTKHDLLGLAREGKLLQEKRHKGRLEEVRLAKRVKEEAELIRRLGEMKIVVDDLAGVSKAAIQAAKSQLSGDHFSLHTKTAPSSLEALSPFVERFIRDFASEYEGYKVDEIVVGAMAPLFRAELTDWNPLEEPTRWTSTLSRWKDALRMSGRQKEEELALASFYGAAPSKETVTADVVQAMTPWEALLWHTWLPKLRSAINNEWDPADASPAVALYEAWFDLIPPFMQDNILDQLIIPKVHRAVSSWKPNSSSSTSTLHSIVFPWLPHVGLRMEEFLGDARRKVRSIFKAIDISRGVPDELMAWKQIFDASQWEDQVLKYIVPKLGATLREDLRINPRNQNMDPLNWVLDWFNHGVIRASIMGQLMAKEFFPKWLETLHRWLTTPKASYEEIVQWYTFWKGTLPPNVSALPAVQEGFQNGVRLMSDWADMDQSQRVNLPKSWLSAAPSQQTGQTTAAKKGSTIAARVLESSFKSIVEEYATEHELLFMPTGRVHEKSRVPMYRVTSRMDGKGGIVVYILDDMVWAVEGGADSGDVEGIGLEEMILLARKGK